MPEGVGGIVEGQARNVFASRMADVKTLESEQQPHHFPNLIKFVKNVEHMGNSMNQADSLRTLRNAVKNAVERSITGDTDRELTPSEQQKLHAISQIFIGPLALQKESLTQGLNDSPQISKEKATQEKLLSAQIQQGLVQGILYASSDRATKEEVEAVFWHVGMLELLSETQVGQNIHLKDWLRGVRNHAAMLKLFEEHGDVLEVFMPDPDELSDVEFLDLKGIDAVVLLRDRTDKKAMHLVCVDAKSGDLFGVLDAKVPGISNPKTQELIDGIAKKAQDDLLSSDITLTQFPKKLEVRIPSFRAKGLFSNEELIDVEKSAKYHKASPTLVQSNTLMKELQSGSKEEMSARLARFGSLPDASADLVVSMLHNVIES